MVNIYELKKVHADVVVGVYGGAGKFLEKQAKNLIHCRLHSFSMTSSYLSQTQTHTSCRQAYAI